MGGQIHKMRAHVILSAAKNPACRRGQGRFFAALRMTMIALIMGAALGVGPTSGPYEQTAIHRKDGGAAPTTQPRGAAAASQGPWDLGKVPLALGGIVLLILGMRWLGKKMVPGGSTRRSSRAVQVLVQSPLSTKQQLLLLQIGRRLVLVGSSGAEMSTLCQIDDPDEVAQVLGQVGEAKGASSERSFRSLIGRAEKAYEPQQAEAPHETERQPDVETTRQELTGLAQRVRRISRQFQGPSLFEGPGGAPEEAGLWAETSDAR